MAVGHITPVVGTYFAYQEYSKNPNGWNAAALGLSLFGDGAMAVSALRGAAMFRGAGGAATRVVPLGAAGAEVNRTLLFEVRQLQAKFVHAADFGVIGNYSRQNAELFKAAIEAHVRDAGTLVILGSYRGKDVTHFLNPTTGLNIMRNANGEFLSGWRLNPTQLGHVLTTGSLGGG